MINENTLTANPNYRDISTNNDYKNTKLDILNKSNNKVLINDITIDGQTKQYSRKNYNISETLSYQPQRIEQINNDISNEINKINGSDNEEKTTANEYKYRITRVNIDSKNRNTIPKNIISNNSYSVLTNPFTLKKNSNIIQITYPNHGLLTNDKITISNVNGSEFFLRELNITKDSTYVKINHPDHNMNPFDLSKIYINYQIQISGITNNGLTYIGNVPLNVLNGYQTIYFNTDNSLTYDVNFYYIKIPVIPNSSITYSNSFKITYRHLYGIPLSSINANYPVNAMQLNGFYIVNNILDINNFDIICDYIANTTISLCGGDNISINKITDYIEGYPNNNHYIISLNKTFYNVNKLRLISTEFPNTDKIIRDTPALRQNNLLYWQILGDGETIYNISVTPGNYNITDLINEINDKISNVSIINNNITSTSTYSYSSSFSSKVSININSNIFMIQFFGTLTIQNPFNFTISPSNSNIYFLEVNHPNHLLQVGTQITIQNSTPIGVIPDNVINTTQTIKSIVDENHYIIQLPPFNILNNNSNVTSGGGIAVQIIYPLIGRLLLNYPGTMCKLLGFRNVGDQDSITQWSYNISNNTQYVNDVLVDNTGVPLTSSVITNYINLNGDNYLLIANPLLKNTVDTGGINGVFAKILLAGPPGYILYNQYIQLGDELNEGVQSLSELEFYFYAQDGTLYEFNGLDHSMTIEIYEKINNNSKLNNNSRI